MAVLIAVTVSRGAGQVIAGPEGPVEFIGLQSWDAQGLFDAIQAIDPDLPFHACAAVMKGELGFADAAAISYLPFLFGTPYTIVVGVEDSTRVRYRPTGSETVVLPDTWQDLQAIADEDLATLAAAARTSRLRSGFFKGVFNVARRLAKQMGADPETLDQVWDLVDSADGEEDHRLAHQVLARDESWSARAIATVVLGNFLDDDTSWHALAGSLIDSDARVRSVAGYVLVGGIPGREGDPVAWSAARGSLLALFGGTNPFGFQEILEVLVQTDIDGQFGRQLARERPDLLLAHVRAEHKRTREPALAFLKTVSGEDFGTDIQAWRSWINGQGD